MECSSIITQVTRPDEEPANGNANSNSNVLIPSENGSLPGSEISKTANDGECLSASDMS